MTRIEMLRLTTLPYFPFCFIPLFLFQIQGVGEDELPDRSGHLPANLLPEALVSLDLMDGLALFMRDSSQKTDRAPDE